MNKDLEKIIKEIECYQNEDMCLIMLSQKENKALLDYITNLQQKVEQYENPDDLTLFYMWLDEKAKDKMKHLQQENERLKHQLKVQEDLTIKNRMRKHIYKSRCEKAISKINDLYSYADNEEYVDNYCKDLLNILQNGSDSQ